MLFCYNLAMTTKDLYKLNIIKNEILYPLEIGNLSNIELFKILENTIDLEEFNLSTISDFDKKFMFEEIEGYLDSKTNMNSLESLLEYIHNKDYDLDTLLYHTRYTEKDIDTTALSSKEISHIADELEASISEYEYQLELHDLEEKVSAIDKQQQELKDLAHEFNIDTDDVSGQNSQFNQLLEDKEKLLKEIQALKENHEQVNREALIKEILAKEFISPKELALLMPNMSISSQQVYRGRLRDKIPFYQTVKGGKIFYKLSEVMDWLDNQNWRHKK